MQRHKSSRRHEGPSHCYNRCSVCFGFQRFVGFDLIAMLEHRRCMPSQGHTPSLLKGTTCESGKCRDPCSPIGGSCGHHSKPNCCGGSTCISGTCQVPSCLPQVFLVIKATPVLAAPKVVLRPTVVYNDYQSQTYVSTVPHFLPTQSHFPCQYPFLKIHVVKYS